MPLEQERIKLSVHKAITKHANNQHETVKAFLHLEEQREAEIEAVVQTAKAGEAFSTESINEITKKMNELAKIGITPQRKLVTADMVLEYIEK